MDQQQEAAETVARNHSLGQFNIVDLLSSVKERVPSEHSPQYVVHVRCVLDDQQVAAHLTMSSEKDKESLENAIRTPLEFRITVRDGVIAKVEGVNIDF